MSRVKRRRCGAWRPAAAAPRPGGNPGTQQGWFAVEPPRAVLLIAVLQGLDVVAERYREAVLASAEMLRRVRAGQAPEAAAYA
jgi:hypothetical protein